jgi:peptide/nickel transport system substrate-binding protein
VVSDEQTLLLQLQSNQLQMAINLVPQQTIGLSATKFTTFSSPVKAQAYYIGCNVKIPPLNNETFRQAMAWAVNRDRINEQVFRNRYRATAGPWAPTSPAYDASQNTYYTYKPAKAKALLQQAGYSGQQIIITPSGSLVECVSIAQIVQSDLQAVGIDTKIQELDSATYAAEFGAGTLPGIFIAQHGFSGMHPATLFLGAHPFNAEVNSSNFVDPAYQSLAQKAWLATGDDAKAVYKQISDLLLSQAFVIGLTMGGDLVTSSTGFKGYSFDAFDNVVYDQAYLA